MTDFCQNCIDNCCNKPAILMFKAEYDACGLTSPYEQFGDIIIMVGPCSALVDGKCSVYKKRPMICKLFPFLRIPLNKFKDPTKNMIGLAVNCGCPRHVEFVLREAEKPLYPDHKVDAGYAHVYAFTAAVEKAMAALSPKQKHDFEAAMNRGIADTVVLFTDYIDHETDVNLLKLYGTGDK